MPSSGRDWMHKMEAEASTRYQVVKFPSANGNSITSVRGDQLLAKKLYAVEIKKEGTTLGIKSRNTSIAINGGPTRSAEEQRKIKHYRTP